MSRAAEPQRRALATARDTTGEATLRQVLLVDDDGRLARVVASYFEEHGTAITVAPTLADAQLLLDKLRFDLILLELQVHGQNGLAFLQIIRSRSPIPIIIVSSQSEEVDRVIGLEMGADDYLGKPFGLRELLARTRAVWRRSRAHGSQAARRRRLAHFEAWSFDIAAHRLTRGDGRAVVLTTGELGILRALVEHPGRVLSRAQLLTMTRHDEDEVFDRTIDVLVVRLRRKLEECPHKPTLIETVRGAGYRLAATVNWEEL